MGDHVVLALNGGGNLVHLMLAERLSNRRLKFPCALRCTPIEQEAVHRNRRHRQRAQEQQVHNRTALFK